MERSDLIKRRRSRAVELLEDVIRRPRIGAPGYKSKVLAVTLTPKGKGRTRDSIIGDFEDFLKAKQSIYQSFLCIETSKMGVVHAHGIIRCNRNYKGKTGNKKVTIFGTPMFDMDSWIEYCLKDNPEHYLKNCEKVYYANNNFLTYGEIDKYI